MHPLTDAQLRRITESLESWAGLYDQSGQWPDRSIDLLGEIGGWRWNVPAEYGGDPLQHRDLLLAYEALSAGCMSTSLISTQRDGAVELIATSANEALKTALLAPLARGEFYTTVGIAQLTTSRRGGGYPLRAVADDGGFRLTGVMPWATGAERARVIVTGAVLANGDQILACVPTDREGVTVEPAERLMSLTASRTSCVRCENYRVEPADLLRGPAPKVLSLRTPVKPLVTSACGLGVAGALLRHIMALRPGIRTHFEEVIGPLTERYETVRSRFLSAADRTSDPQYELPSTEIRVMVNDVVIRMAIAALTLAKGSGFIADRPVQRRVREALFFLVWSAPPSVQLETIVRLMRTFGEDPAPLVDL